MKMTKIVCLFIPILFIGCTTIYRVPFKNSSIYLLQKGNKIEVFDFEGKNTKGTYSEFSYFDLETYHHLGISIEKSSNNFVYFKDKVAIDTMFLDSTFHQKKNILPILLPPVKEIVCNGINIYNYADSIEYLVKYEGESEEYFNNQDPMKVHLFYYYAVFKNKGYGELNDPIILSISKESGIVMELSYFIKQRVWYYNPKDTATYTFKSLIGISDYSKVLILNKKRLRKFLM
jgi:hypothetical protein